MEHYKLFPTHLFVFDDFYKDSVSEMKKYISDLWKKRDYDNNWQTKSADLQKKVEFADFTKEIIAANKTIKILFKFILNSIFKHSPIITCLSLNLLY